MLSRLTRPAAAVAVSIFAFAALSACGDDTPEAKTASGFDAVEVSGDVGDKPEIDWKAMLEAGDETRSEVVEEGDGPVLEEGDRVVTNFAVSNDVEQDISYDTYDSQAVLLSVGSDTEPTQVADLITGLINEQVEAGTTTVGTRIAITADAKKEFGDLSLNLSSLGIGNEDGFVVVADLEAVPLDGPEGRSKPAPSWAPEITTKKGKPTALDSSAQPEPDAKSKDLEKALLVEGTGAVVKKGDQIVVNYIGQVFGAEEPFDNGFSRPDPSIFKIGVGAVVKGWDRGLVGEKVGSRVLLRIPPKLGYGKQGSPDGSVKPDQTLYFIVDLLAAA